MNASENDLAQSALYLIEHPLLTKYLTILRRKDTKMSEYRWCVEVMTRILLYEAVSLIDYSFEKVKYTAINGKQKTGLGVRDDSLVFMAILRSGLLMSAAGNVLFPDTPVWQLGTDIKRNGEKHKRYDRFPTKIDVSERHCFVMDASIETGQTALESMKQIKKHGMNFKSITYLSIVAKKQGYAAFASKYGNIPVITAAIEEDNEPISIGSAGDRIHGVDTTELRDG